MKEKEKYVFDNRQHLHEHTKFLAAIQNMYFSNMMSEMWVFYLLSILLCLFCVDVAFDHFYIILTKQI